MDKDKIILDMSEFFEAEKKKQKKSDDYMEKLYENRADKSKDKDREIIFFLFNYLGSMYFRWSMSTNNIYKLTYGIGLFAWEKEIWNGIDNYLQFRKSQI